MPETAVLGHTNTGSSPAIEGSPNVFIGGAPVLRQGDLFADGSAVTAGASHVFINGKAAARLDDPVTGGRSVAQGCKNVRIGNGGGPGAFQRALERNATEKEKLLLCVPRIALAMAAKEKDETEKQGWLYLHDMMTKWLTGPVNREAKTSTDPFRIDWDWVMRLPLYTPIPTKKSLSPAPTSPKDEYEAFVVPFQNGPFSVPPFIRDPNLALDQQKRLPDSFGQPEPPDNIYNTKTKQSLGVILARDGFLKEINGQKTPFDFTASPWQEWEAKYHTLRVVPQPYGIGGQQAALAGFTLRALAKGDVEFIRKGVFHIRVTGVAVFAHDLFNFAPDGVEWLGHWSCENGDVIAGAWDYINDEKLPGFLATPPPPGYAILRNQDYRNYQDKYGLGHDFIVLSQTHTVENFEIIEYDYPL